MVLGVAGNASSWGAGCSNRESWSFVAVGSTSHAISNINTFQTDYILKTYFRFSTLFLYPIMEFWQPNVLRSVSYCYYMLCQSCKNQTRTQGILIKDSKQSCKQGEGYQKGMLQHPENSNWRKLFHGLGQEKINSQQYDWGTINLETWMDKGTSSQIRSHGRIESLLEIMDQKGKEWGDEQLRFSLLLPSILLPLMYICQI